MIDPSQATAEIDEAHAQSRAAFGRRDLAAYREFFAPELAYRQADGHVIDRDRLMIDVEDQFRRFDRVRSSFTRERIDFEGDRATETLVQSAAAGTTAFFVVHREWVLARHARYTWSKRSGRWRIEEVEVLSEEMRPGRFRIGFRAPSLASGGEDS